MGTGVKRWRARPWLSRLLRVVIFITPIAGSLEVALAVRALLPPPRGLGHVVLWWLAIAVPALVTLFLVDRVTHRLLPLAGLLRLSLIFPDKVPSRIAIARRAGRVRDIHAEAQKAREEGEPARAIESILALVGALAAHDRPTRGHSERVRVFAELLAEELRLTAYDRELLRWAALLHDIGKLTVSPAILNKPGRPAERDWEQIHRHPDEGFALAAPLAGWLGPWTDTIAHHHERFDGTGYPRGLSGEEISLGGRIVAVADSYDTMTAARAYKRPMTAVAARTELALCAGAHFDPAVVRAFLNIAIGRLRRRSGIFVGVASLSFVPRPAFARVRGLSHQLANGAAALAALALTVAILPGVRAPGVTRGVAPGPVAVLGETIGAATPTAGPGPAGSPTSAPAPAAPAVGGEAPGDAPAAAPTPVPVAVPSGPVPTPTPDLHGKCVSSIARDRDKDHGGGSIVPDTARDPECLVAPSP